MKTEKDGPCDEWIVDVNDDYTCNGGQGLSYFGRDGEKRALAFIEGRLAADPARGLGNYTLICGQRRALKEVQQTTRVTVV